LLPAGIEAARMILEDFDADERFRIDWQSASYSVKLRDPIDPAQVYTLLVVERMGRAYVGWLDGQLARAGLPQELGRPFVREAGLLVGCAVHPTMPDGWQSPAPLDAVAQRRAEFKELIERFAAEVYALRRSASQSGADAPR
jgi:hypothetical protein